MTRRATFYLFVSGCLHPATVLERLAGNWRTRISVIHGGRRTYTRLRLTFTAAGLVAIEEYEPAGPLAFVYKGALELKGESELSLKVAEVSDPNGRTVEDGRGRYQAGETYNLGAVEFLSSSRVRIGSMEALKELS